MRLHTHALFLMCFAAVAASDAAAGTVTVSFVNASSFSDAGSTPWEEDANLKALSSHLQGLGQKYLPADQVLKFEVLDVDLAGTTRPSRRSGTNVRIVKGGADWPRIGLRYRLESNGNPTRSGEESVADINYTRGLATARESASLFYEKRMLDEWFKARFVEGLNPSH